MVDPRIDLPPGDYVSAGLRVIMPDACFPNMIVGDKLNHPWPYLRREIPHNWYCDQRATNVGFLNRDEVTLLYNLALPFAGRPGLEIGAWMGWSTCHLALAGLVLDVIDPVLAGGENATSVRESLEAAGVLNSVRLYGAASPDGVRQLAELRGVKWSFFFIDGDHEAPAPERDAEEAMRHAAADALVVFHDLASPDVERGLDVLYRAGWNTLVYQTMQIVGVAWRGNVRPVHHIPDASVQWELPRHLAKYAVSGLSPESEVRRLAHLLSLRDQKVSQFETILAEKASAIERLNAQIRGLAAEVNDSASHLAATQEASLADREARQTRLRELATELRERGDDLKHLKGALGARNAEISQLRDRAARAEAKASAFEGHVAMQETEITRLHAEVGREQAEVARLTARTAAAERDAAFVLSETVRLESSLNALLHSDSLRLTQPLRNLKRLGR